jgi:tetratricopeptide (TPR) repeat protein
MFSATRNNLDTSNPESSRKSSVSRLLERQSLQLALIVVMAICAYSNTFFVPFILDDEASIIRNEIIKNLGMFFEHGYSFSPTRFIGYLTFALNHSVHGLHLAGYHIVNLLIHIGNGLLVYALVTSMFRTPLFKYGDREPGIVDGAGAASRLLPVIPFLVALLFVCHPIQTQAVTYIVQRLTSLATLFYLSSVLLYLRWRLALEAGESFMSKRVLPAWLLASTLAFLAMKTKEIAFTLPFMVLLAEFCCFGRPTRRVLVLLVPLFLVSLTLIMALLGPDLSAESLLANVNTATESNLTLSRGTYLVTQFSVIVTYLRLLVLPVNQNLDYDYPISRSLLEPRALLSLLFLLALAGAAVFLWRGKIGTGDQGPGTGQQTNSGLCRLAGFGIFWFFLTLIVESSVIPLLDVIFEHRLYLPSVGFFITVVCLLAIISRRLPVMEKLLLPGVVAIAFVLAGATYARNLVWKDWITLWSDVVAKSPGKARPHNVLGIGYINQNRNEKAIHEFQTAIALNLNYMEAYFNYGVALNGMGLYDEAITVYRKALKLAPYDADIYNDLGENYARKGDMNQAVVNFSAAVNLKPRSVHMRRNLGHALLRAGDRDGALREFRTVLEIRPDDQETLRALDEMERTGK